MSVVVSADALLEQLRQIDVTKLPTMCRDRNIGMKEQAKLARSLFKRLGLKGIRVRMATGANCFWVHIIPPHADDCDVQVAIREHLKEILARSFPCHDDRSDYMSDYFDYCWSIR